MHFCLSLLSIFIILKKIIGLIFLSTVVACTPEFIPEEVANRDANAVILPTEDPNGRTGEVVASFLSSEHDFTFSTSNMTSETLRVSYVTTAQNFDIFKWVFEGGTIDSNIGTSTVNTETNEQFLTIEGSLRDSTASRIGVLINYPGGFGRYDVIHAVANANSFDVNTQRQYVTYEYQDDLIVQNSSASVTTGWENEQQGWFSPSDLATVTFSPCENALVGFYTASNSNADEATMISKDFSGFGLRPKNLVFEYKMDFLVLPNTNEESKKISLGYTPIVSGIGSDTQLEPAELWSDSTYDVTEFRQVVLPLPLIADFRLSFIKHPSPLNEQGQQLYPFSVCLRDIRIVPGNEN